MIVDYRIWLKDRENPKSRMQFVTGAFYVDDIIETALELMIKNTDTEWICYRVDLVSIEDFAL